MSTNSSVPSACLVTITSHGPIVDAYYTRKADTTDTTLTLPAFTKCLLFQVLPHIISNPHKNYIR